MCTGECDWIYLGGPNPWAKVSDTCSEGCHCFAPTHVAKVGTHDTTDCNTDEAPKKKKPPA